MGAKEIIDNIGVLILAVIGGSGIIQIAPIKINPWSWVFQKMGAEAGKGLYAKLDSLEGKMNNLETKVDKLETKVDDLEAKIEAVDIRVKSHEDQRDEQETVGRRRRILRFADECRKNEKHSLEHFNEILDDISQYKKYCDEHPKFKNDKCTISVEFVEQAYKHCVETDDFL